MKRLLNGLAAAAVLFGISSMAHAETKTINLKKGLPAKIEISVGDDVVIEDGTATITTSPTDNKKDTLLEQRMTNGPKQVAVYRASRDGEGEITVTFPAQGQLTVVRTKTIEVKVKPADLIRKVQFKRPFSDQIEIKTGESIVLYVPFKGDPGLYDPINVPGNAATADGKKGDVLETKQGVKRLDNDNIQIIRYDALRAGQAEIVVTNFSGKEVGRIKVTVK